MGPRAPQGPHGAHGAHQLAVRCDLPPRYPHQPVLKHQSEDKQRLLDEILGQGADIARRPSRSGNSAVHMQPGGVFITEVGNKRRPTLFQVAGAWAIAWCRFSQLTLMASFVRCGWYSHEEDRELLGESPQAILAGVTDLARRQQALKRRGAWLHKDQDFSGGAGVEAEPVPEPTAEEQVILNRNLQEVQRLQECLRSRALTTVLGGS